MHTIKCDGCRVLLDHTAFIEYHRGDMLCLCGGCAHAYHDVLNGGKSIMALKDWKNCPACKAILSYNSRMMRCEDCGFSDYRKQVADAMANEPLQSRKGSQVWYPGQKEPYYRPKPKQKQPEIKKPPLRLEQLKTKVFKICFNGNWDLSMYDLSEDGFGPQNLVGLREIDFEQFATDLKDQMEKLRLNNGSHHSSIWGQQRSPFWFIHEEPFMPKVIVIHDAETASYDLKFDIKGSGAWTAVEGVIAIIKATIPVSDRAYDPGSKQWSIAEKYWPNLKQLLEHSTFMVEESKKLSREDFFYEAPTPAAPTRDSLGVVLTKLLGIDSGVLGDDALLKKAYRKKALELHPDRNNGDGSRMSELNSIWTQYISN